ncbi:MAG: hypothetical protein M1818_001352 [Claussenomyces sp. TS43310]|nr:MAG: hypothetical protein M1818_001352 [Claussenomyces sp. TS43310]
MAPPIEGVRIVCISDTHNTQPTLPDGDVLLHAGDLTQSGSLAELERQIEWLDAQPHRFKVVIAGNHDLCLDHSKQPLTAGGRSFRRPNWRSLIYLQDSSTVLRLPGGRPLKIYGSPWTPEYGNWAFQYPRTDNDSWRGTIPDDTDILLTHGPPEHHLDSNGLGCSCLLHELWTKRSRPPLHVFGHIHAGYGRKSILWDPFEMAHERAVSQNGTWLDVLRMILSLISRFRNIALKETRGTVFVNAAVVGDFGDEEYQNQSP